MVKSDKGAAAVEFAIIAPLLFVLLFGIIEFSAVLYNQAVITNASREGARYAVTYYRNPSSPLGVVLPTQTEIGDYITAYVNSHIISFTEPNPNIGNPDLTQKLDTDSFAGWITEVTVNYDYNFLVFGNLIQLLSGGTKYPGIKLSAMTRMRNEDQVSPSP